MGHRAVVVGGATSAAVDCAIEQRPAAIMLSFGDPTPFADACARGHPLMIQVTTLADAKRALDLGADVVVAQGAEAGGHGEGRGTAAVRAGGGRRSGSDVPCLPRAASPTAADWPRRWCSAPRAR